MIKEKTVTAIILVAGNSTRFGKDRNKNLERIKGKEILLYSLETFDQNALIDQIIVVAKTEEKEEIKQVIEQEKRNKTITYVAGGNTRQESVYYALLQTNSDIVIIHDGARPLIQQTYINDCIESMNQYKGVTTGVKSKDTIKITNDQDEVVDTTNRSHTWIVQTPQCFDKKVLLNAHEKWKNDPSITDDCMLLEKEKEVIKMIKGDYFNIKVTTYEDIHFVNQFLAQEK